MIERAKKMESIIPENVNDIMPLILTGLEQAEGAVSISSTGTWDDIDASDTDA